jgi:predicted RNA binding protein YcfA (HicA-like mRNA interferase family)
MSLRKELHQLAEEAEKQGWTITSTKGDHRKWVSPKGGIVFTSATPSDRRAIFKIRRDLRLNGFIEIKAQKKRK